MSRSILSLSKIPYQMQHDHPFSQWNWTTERTVGQGSGGGLDEIWKGEVGNIGGSS